MKVLKIAGTPIDLREQESAFAPGATVVLWNLTAGALSILTSDASNGDFYELVNVAASEIINVTLDNAFIMVDAYYGDDEVFLTAS